ncbi:MAG: TolC family protein [Oligoflexia bacterium]
MQARQAFVFIALLTSSAQAAPALPTDALALLKTLPNQRLELPFVLARAAETSDSFKAAYASLLTTDIARLQAESQLAWRPFAKFAQVRDSREAGNSFSPNRLENQVFSLGVSTAFQSGTRVQAEISQGSNFIRFPTAGFGPFDYSETRTTLSLNQSLLADSFGQATRALQRSADKASLAQGLTARETIEDWALGLVRLYYGAWLAQAQVRASVDGYERKLRLKQLLDIQARRGTAERPDVLQVENATTTTLNQKEQNELKLQDTWRDLVIALKLNPEWVKINPVVIPMALDDPQTEAKSLCGKEGALHPAPESLQLTRARLQAESARDAEKRARALLRPNLDFQAAVFANGIAPTSSESFRDLNSLDYTGYSLGLMLSFPIGFTAEKADALSATSNAIRADAGQSIARDMNDSGWVSRCMDLFRLDRAAESFARTARLQRERSQLEEQRFKLGRSGTFQVIQAGDDATIAELARDGIEVERRLAAWQILKIAGRMPKLELPTEAAP